jgi:hypothetical protein
MLSTEAATGEHPAARPRELVALEPFHGHLPPRTQGTNTSRAAQAFGIASQAVLSCVIFMR